MDKSTLSKLTISNIADHVDHPIRSIYISSYIPRRCGIANFTKDLTTAVNNLNPHSLAEIIAVTDRDQEYEYPWEVKYRINQDRPEDYLNAAHYINQSSADVVNLQHEFGLFGGVDGDYILPMIDIIEKPIVSNFHSVLPNPDQHKLYVMQRIIEKSTAIIAMTQNTKKILMETYGAPEDKIAVIYHGVPDFSFEATDKYKKRLKINRQHMLLMSGLLGPGKGIEYVIEALPEIIKVSPDVIFYILGQTHPTIKRNEGEKYRNKLKARIKELGISRNVKFINKYIDLDTLILYYKATDIYLTPHADPQQPMSGTLAYALGAGKICVSTPFAYAKEVLKNDTGILVDFNSAKSIAEKISEVLADPEMQATYRKNAYKIGRLMTWANIGGKYLSLFKLIYEETVDKNAIEKSA